jgi:hypothetical protein
MIEKELIEALKNTDKLKSIINNVGILTRVTKAHPQYKEELIKAILNDKELLIIILKGYWFDSDDSDEYYWSDSSESSLDGDCGYNLMQLVELFPSHGKQIENFILNDTDLLNKLTDDIFGGKNTYEKQQCFENLHGIKKSCPELCKEVFNHVFDAKFKKPRNFVNWIYNLHSLQKLIGYFPEYKDMFLGSVTEGRHAVRLLRNNSFGHFLPNCSIDATFMAAKECPDCKDVIVLANFYKPLYIEKFFLVHHSIGLQNFKKFKMVFAKQLDNVFSYMKKNIMEFKYIELIGIARHIPELKKTICGILLKDKALFKAKVISVVTLIELMKLSSEHSESLFEFALSDEAIFKNIFSPNFEGECEYFTKFLTRDYYKGSVISQINGVDMKHVNFNEKFKIFNCSTVEQGWERAKMYMTKRDIKFASCMIAQGARYKKSFFSKIPRELRYKIAAAAGDKQISKGKVFFNIAKKEVNIADKVHTKALAKHKEQAKTQSEVKRASILVAQGARCQGSFFNHLPQFPSALIAAYVGEACLFDDKEHLNKLASDTYQKALTK